MMRVHKILIKNYSRARCLAQANIPVMLATRDGSYPAGNTIVAPKPKSWLHLKRALGVLADLFVRKIDGRGCSGGETLKTGGMLQHKRQPEFKAE